ncbi:hypothetical protein Leryth_005892 [Lithospermum erythrorhizon]|nr:hypothetical protein Leryth_005892 [Lithospermum erythrorhizon]
MFLVSALLRLPEAKKQAATRVQALLKELGLEHVAESRVGQGSNHGISGGERRRVSIGAELVHDPPVILIDEPTSGLDSASAFHIISTLKLMALNKGKTIVLTIHQPGFRILQLIDRLVLLSNGCVIHNGSLQQLEERLNFSGQSIPRHVNVLEFAIEVSIFLTNPERRLNTDHSVTTSLDDDIHVAYSNSHFEEIHILAQRFSKITFRTNQLFATRIIQSIIASLILGTIYMNIDDKRKGDIALQARVGFFAFTLTFLLSSTTEALPIFLQERRIFMNETSRGAYRVSSYVIANTLVFLPFLLLIGFLYATPAYWLVGLRPKIEGYIYFCLVVWLVILMANSFTACFSALVPNFIMGTSLIAGLMGSFFLFSGYFISKEKIPSYWKFMHYLSLFKYPFECFLINEYGGGGDNKCLTSQGDVCTLYRDGFLMRWGLEESQKWSNIAVMLGFILFYRLLCYFILLVRWYIRCR